MDYPPWGPSAPWDSPLWWLVLTAVLAALLSRDVVVAFLRSLWIGVRYVLSRWLRRILAVTRKDT